MYGVLQALVYSILQHTLSLVPLSVYLLACSLGVVLGCVLPGALCGACWLGCGCWLGCAGLVCSVWAAWWCSLPWLFSVSRFSLFTVFHFSYRDLRLMLVSGVPGLVSGREM
ncbi:Hypothetical_protein [Hexamita inflata]|uniref:Hypothetical_protein n=1 Tax=Hexamita inflata TaxID=28002 RepID=A0AA86R445_9EUKA|nr:Hypothetical protein HINF_LOCUS56203 [Hexamita inflata]